MAKENNIFSKIFKRSPKISDSEEGNNLKDFSSSEANIEESLHEDLSSLPLEGSAKPQEPLEKAVLSGIATEDEKIFEDCADIVKKEEACFSNKDNIFRLTPSIISESEENATSSEKLFPGQAPKAEVKLSWFARLKSGLSRSKNHLGDAVSSLLTKSKLTQTSLDSLEDVLLQADLGLETAIQITDKLAKARYDKDISEQEVREIMAQEIETILRPVAKTLELDLNHKPYVIIFVGVNGSGKTTTIGKLAGKLTRSGLKVMLAACDTFRAAAIDQLHVWAMRSQAQIISSHIGADAASLAYEAYEKAKNTGQDVLIIDTAGRLQNKVELMEECAKIIRVLKKQDPTAPHIVLQSLDATTGQNALNQVEIFQKMVGVNGLIMTKLDGTARGGILVAIAKKFQLPIYLIGVGEGEEDLESFSAEEFSKAIVGL